MIQAALPYVPKNLRRGSQLFALVFICISHLRAQTVVPLSDLSSFQNPSSSWRIAGGVFASLEKDNLLTTTPGTGILVNLPEQKAPGKDLLTQLQHGDADVELDYLMAKKSNSGIYLQGRYEIQLLDSWGVRRPNYGDNGGIYERWDDSRGKGKEGYEGFAPRQNVTRAPGLWQHLKISFQAPRFDATGKKTENARIIRAELNGVVIHENVEMAGVTRGASGVEAATGPLRIQGDHGAVAIRNLKITNYDKARPELTALKYTVYKGLYEKEPDYAKLPPEASGPYGTLSSNINNLPDSFLLRYTGTLKIKEPGEYVFNLSTLAGTGALKINNQIVTGLGGRSNRVRATLPAGDLPFELLYSKFMDWGKPSLGLSLSGPGVREFSLAEGSTTA
ncbi:MAG TPA: family 16 glycoside hydrolase, partial [Chitinophagaceae bacterium]|nr:family 16 glycoside hydrolase [Chitinophagaceae bacterium]